MTAVLESPLGDVPLEPVSARGWAVALGVAVLLHLAAGGGWLLWQAAAPAVPAAIREEMIEVALGPPGGRLDPPPPPPVAAPPAEPLPQATRTERAKDAPPIAMTAPAPEAPVNAALSSGFGEGGDGLLPPPPEPAPPPPPPPPPPPALDRLVLKAYVNRVSQVIFEQLIYPDAARRAGLGGAALLAIEIDRQGQVVRAELKRSSGHEILDKAIFAAVGRVRRYPPLPDGYGRPSLRVSVPIRFTLVDSEDIGRLDEGATQ